MGTGRKPHKDLILHIFSNLLIGENGCWVWQKCKTPEGYPQTFYNKKTIQVNRYVWEYYNGPIPEKMNLCHHCDNPPCCNPEHHFVGTQKQNIQDASNKKRLLFGANHNSHHKTENNRKLTVDDIISIRKDTREPHDIASEYGLHKRYIYKIKKRETWAWV